MPTGDAEFIAIPDEMGGVALPQAVDPMITLLTELPALGSRPKI